MPLSFRLHAELCKEHDGENKWGYRRINCGQVEARARRLGTQAQQRREKEKNSTVNGEPKNGESISLQKRSQKAIGQLRAAGFPADLDWIAPETAVGYDEMSKPGNTAQVHPYQFTTAIAELAEQAGVKMEIGARVTAINKSSGSTPSVESVSYTKDGQDHTIPADACVLAAGPWTQGLLPSAPISGLRAHSVTIKPTRHVSPYCLFTSIDLPSQFYPDNAAHPKNVAPEIYARPNQEVYACGEGDSLVPLPKDTASVATDESRCQDIIDYIGSISDELRDGEVTARQACYLPVTNGRGGPYIGEVNDMKNLILAAGHSCWGISNGPGTGKVVSEIIMDGKPVSAKLGNLDPKRGM